MVLHLAPLFLAIIVSLTSEIQQINSSNQHLLNDADAAKLRISQLEAVLDASTQKVDAKTLHLKELEKLIKDAESQIHDLQSDSYSLESGLPLVQKRISELEEEMTEVVTEQWIQVQHLEQMREFNNRRHHTPSRCTLLKLISDIHWDGKKASLFVQSYLTQALSQLKSLWAAVTRYHHQLQGFIKHEMERNEITAALANREVVFFMASALITFPVFGAWILLSA